MFKNERSNIIKLIISALMFNSIPMKVVAEQISDESSITEKEEINTLDTVND